MSISLNTANSNSIANYETIDGDGNVHNDQASEIALLSAKQPDKLSEIVNSFSNTSIFCEIALQRLQLSQSYRTNAGMQMEQMKEYQGQITALNMLDQCAREGKTVKIESPSDLEQYKSNLQQVNSLIYDYMNAFDGRTSEFKAQELERLHQEIRYNVDSMFDADHQYYDSITIAPDTGKPFIETTVEVSSNFKELVESLGVSAKLEERFYCIVTVDEDLESVGLYLDPPRINKESLIKLQEDLRIESTLKLNALALRGMGFTEVPKFADSKIGEAEKEKFTVKIEMKKDEVDHKMNTTMAYLQDYVEQAQANMTKASKNLDKYDELLAEVVSKKK